MKIGINGYESVVPRFGFDNKTGLPIRVGSGQYGFEIIKNLNEIDRRNDYLVYLPVNPTKDMPKVSENWKYKILSSRRLWTVTALTPHFLRNRSNVDVFFTPTHYLPPFAPKNSVISILDVSYIYFPQLFTKKDLIQLKKWTHFSARKARKILTISESSKSDIIKEYRVKSEKVQVIYPGIKSDTGSKNHTSMDDLKKKFKIDDRYILFVGTLQPRKNIVKLIEAFSKLENDIGLIIVGKKGWNYEEILAAPKKFGVEDKVIFIHDASDDDLTTLYKNAQFFILPSLYEGFGLPVLEAMSFGTPVITSNISSLPEAGGDAALYIDPNNVNDMTKKMKELLDNEDLRKDLIKKGHEQVKKFSWEKSARETLTVLESL